MIFGYEEQVETALSAPDRSATLSVGRGSPDFLNFPAEVVALGGHVATACEMPVEVGLESDRAVGLRRGTELDVYRVIEAAAVTGAALPGVRGLRIGLAGWRDLLHAVVRVEGTDAGNLDAGARELAAVREHVAALDGTFDIATTGAATFHAVLPVLAARTYAGLGAIPLGLTSTVERSVEPRTLNRHIAAAAVGVGLDRAATDRVLDRLNQVTPTWQLADAASSSTSQAPQGATLRVAIYRGHALLVAETGTRVVAFWEPLRRGTAHLGSRATVGARR